MIGYIPVSINSRSSQDDTTYPSLVVYTLTALGDGLSVRFHVSLLEVVGELVEVLVVGEQRVGLCACTKMSANSGRARRATHVRTIEVVVVFESPVQSSLSPKYWKTGTATGCLGDQNSSNQDWTAKDQSQQVQL